MESDDIQRFMRYDEVVNPLPDLADIFLSNDGFCSMDIAHKDGEIQSLSGADSLFQYSQLHHPDASNILNLYKQENSIEDQGIDGTKFSESAHSNPSTRLEESEYIDEIPCNGGVNQLSTLNNCCDVTRKSKSPQSETKPNGTEAKVVGVCGVCRFTYSTYKEKEDHMKGSDHICKREALSGTNFKMLAGETELLKSVEKLPQPCSVCKKPLPSLQEFLVHHRKHSGKIPFVCIRCKASFTKRSDLIYHIKKHLGVNNFMCSRCPSSFRQQSRLTSHMIAQHGIKDTRPRNFNCTECNESFMSKSAVNMHMQSHTGYRPIKCPECGHGFRSNTALAAHQRVHTGEKPFKCDLCAFSTKTKQLLSRHSRKHSGYKPYKCDHCTFSASCSAGLKRHQLQHTGSKPFQCPYCSYRSSNIENLRKHIKNTTKHTGLKIYPCHHCEFSCDQGSDYLKHMKRHFPYLDVDSESATKLAGILVSDHNEEIAQPVTSNFGNSEVQLSSGEDDDIHVEMLVNGHEENAHEVEVRNKGSSNLAELDTDLLNALIKIPNLQKIILPQDSSNGPVTLVIGSDQPFPHLPDMYQEEDVNDVQSFKMQPNVSLNHSVNLG